MLNIYRYHTKPKQLDHYRELAPVMKDVRADRLPEDPQYWPIAMSIRGSLLSRVPKPRRTRDLCLAAVSQEGWALQFVPEELRDRNLCLAAVSQFGGALQFVPEELRDLDACLAAVNQFGWALQFVPKKILRRYPEIAQAAKQAR